MHNSEAYFATFVQRSAEDAVLTVPEGLTILPAQLADVGGLARVHCERHGGSIDEQTDKYSTEISDNVGWVSRLLLAAIIDNEVVGFGRVIYFTRPLDAPTNMAPAGWYLAG